MSKLATAKELYNKTMVGYLLDVNQFQMAISPLMHNNIPLPIIFASSAIRWNENSLLLQDPCTNLSLMQLFEMPRINITADALREICNDQTDTVIANSELLNKTPPRSHDETDINTRLMELTAMVKENKAKNKELTAMVKENKAKNKELTAMVKKKTRS